MVNEINKDEVSERIKELRHEISYLSVAGVVLALVGMRGCHHAGRIADSLELATQDKQSIQIGDVLGNEQPERFYELNGQRVYLEVDGKPVESYFSQKPIQGGIR